MGSSIDLSEVGTKLTNHDDRQWQQQNVADLLNRRMLGFPGAQPVSFARHHLDELRQTDYFMCEKTDGIRCLLFLTSRVGEGGVLLEEQFLIDRKNDYYFIAPGSLHVPLSSDQAPGFDIESFHRGTLLDGELVRQHNKNGGTHLAYLIFDCLALNGDNLTQRPFDKRFGKADTLVSRPYRKFTAYLRQHHPQELAEAPFNIQCKKMELPYGVEMMFKEVLRDLPHGNDGLIFTCVTTGYVFGTDQHILKWKPPHENTIDFRLQIGEFPMLEDEEGQYEDWDAKPEFHLLVNHGRDNGGGYQYFSTLTITDEEWSAMKNMNQMFDGRIIECFRDPVSTQWRPKIEEDGTPRFRDDKTDANHIAVVNSVLESIKDAVTEQDLIDNALAVKNAYKARQARKSAPRPPAPQQQQQQQQQHVPPVMQQRQPLEVEMDDGPRYED